ncbi:hypothetical protein GCM10023258_33210 [Terrabacter aeriphilus]|uniref:Uncharacterized protein n=1 Tax=Terrabacter aeriphilus TaxID=515662 RepID=A0ABP9JL81_9MICO
MQAAHSHRRQLQEVGDLALRQLLREAQVDELLLQEGELPDGITHDEPLVVVGTGGLVS